MTDTTSSDGGATPPPASPATGTPAPGSATPPAATLTLEAALQRIAELEHSHGNATEELKRHRSKLSTYEKAEAERTAAQKAAEEAQLGELERTNKRYTELQAQYEAYTRQMQERVVRYEVERQAAKLGIIDPEAATKLLDWTELEYEEDGTPKNAEKLLEKLLKSKPYLAPKPVEPPEQAQPAPATPAQSGQPVRPPAIPAVHPGRAAIPAPTTTPPGKIPTWNDVYGRKS